MPSAGFFHFATEIFAVSLHFVTNSANSHFPNQMKDPESINTSFA
jgi:hypothetical protein